MSFATLRKTVCTDIDIGTALKEITSNPHIGDALAFDLLDGRHIECAVTDIDDKAIRFDSVDCLGDDMTYGKVEKWLDRIDHLMPDELRKAIIDTERKHTIDGKKVCRLERLFLPAVSELFSGDAVQRGCCSRRRWAVQADGLVQRSPPSHEDGRTRR